MPFPMLAYNQHQPHPDTVPATPLLEFAGLVKDMFTSDSSGHAKYLHEQAILRIADHAALETMYNKAVLREVSLPGNLLAFSVTVDNNPIGAIRLKDPALCKFEVTFLGGDRIKEEQFVRAFFRVLEIVTHN